ncbi:MAG: class I SAM-dependent methyltransferase [Desulfobacterales bacterium]|nr:class I SAM-dependent methyltransferase [Desulfobacterales bacterium]
MKLGPIERWFVNSPLRQAMQALVIRWFRAVMPLGPGADILEIGCGAGAGARMLARQFKPRRLVLTDIDPRMVRLARIRLSHGASPPPRFCVGDAARLPFRSETAHAVFGFGFLHHVPAWRDGLAEIHRVLKPEGLYYFEEYYPSLYQNCITRRLAKHPEHDRFTGSQLREEFARAKLDLRCTLELKRFGILGVCAKKNWKP